MGTIISKYIRNFWTFLCNFFFCLFVSAYMRIYRGNHATINERMYPSFYYDLAMLTFDYKIHLYIKNIEHFLLESLKSLAFLLF